MKRHNTRLVVVLIGFLATVLTSTLPLRSAFSEGGARRDVIRQQEQHVRDATTYAKEAVDDGKRGHAENLATHAEASLQHAVRGGSNPHLAEAISNLKEAIEHGKAGHADVATKHVESAVTHLSQVK